MGQTGCFVLRAVAAFLLLMIAGSSAAAQESPVPIGRCDRLPVVPVQVDGEEYRFLLDTAATTILNQRVFTGGRSTRREVSSWSGLRQVKGTLVRVGEMVVGQRRFAPQQLPALDLSAIEKVCGGRIDGILGIDLLTASGAVVDFSQQVMHVPKVNLSVQRQEAEQHYRKCLTAFNREDVAVLKDCFDFESVLVSAGRRLRGAEDILAYLGDRYFQGGRKLEIQLTDTRASFAGDTYWRSYHYRIHTGKNFVEGEGLSICQRGKDGWRMLVMQNLPSAPLAPGGM